MKNLGWTFVSLTIFLGLTGNIAFAQIVSNGDFTIDAFTNFPNTPGYEGQTGGGYGSGNGAIPDWTAAGNTQNGGTTSGVNGSTGYANYNQFGPESDSIQTGPDAPTLQPGAYAFIQNDNGQGTLTQNITLAANTTYVLTFEAAVRNGDSGLASGSVTVNAGDAGVLDNLIGINATSFTTYTDTFTTDSNVASTYIVLKNTSNAEAGRTVAFTDISIEAVPEPSTYALLGLGLAAMVIVSRIRRRSA